MPPDPRMKVLEAQKKVGLFGKSWALSISSVIDETNTIETEFRHTKEAVINWHNQHGKQCQSLILVFEADEREHQRIAEYVTGALNADAHLFPIIETLNTKIVVIDPSGVARLDIEAKPS